MSEHAPCVLASLDNPMLNGLSLGLQNLESEQLSLQTQLFRCCEGAGFAWQERTQGYTRCKVRQRLRRVQALVDQYRRQWPQQPRNFMQTSPSWAASTLQELAATLRHDLPPAHLLYSPQRATPSRLWPLAFALCWRFGVEARILSLQKIDPASLAAFTADSAEPIALLVEQVDRLWDPLYAEALEFIIQRAYNAEAWLWLDVVYQPAKDAELSDEQNLRASFSRKIAKMKNQHPLDSLTSDGQSRLRSMLRGSWALPTGDSRHA